MTTPHWWNYALEATYFTSYSAVAVQIVRSKMLHAWPRLFSLCIATVTMTVATFGLYGRASTYTAYFYTHWIGEAILALLMLAVLYETVHTIPLVRQIPSALRTFLATVIVASTTSAVIYQASQATHTAYALTNAALTLETCSAVAWCVFALGLFAAVGITGLAWTELPLRIARGAAWQTLVALAASHAVALRPTARAPITILSDCLHLCAVPYWYWALRQQDSAKTEDLAALETLLPSLRFHFTLLRKGDTP